MEWNFESVVFYLLLIDALIAFFMAFSGKQQWWSSHLGAWAKHFPLSRGWTALYLALVFFVGSILYRHELLTTLW